MNTYLTAEFAEQIGVSKTSVNHYINILEACGYQVSRNARKYREYTEHDVEIVRALIALNKERGLKLKEAAQLVMAPDFSVQEVVGKLPMRPVEHEMSKQTYIEISRSMELLATHVHGIEQQNEQLIQLIQAQRQQNELLMEQNNTLKHELGSMMQHLMDKANAPVESANRQMNRIEQQNSAIMSVLNTLNTKQHEMQTEAPNPEKEKGLFSRFLK